MPTFSYTGAEQTYTVPAGVTSVVVECWGAQGGTSYPGYDGYMNLGGKGGYAKGRLAVTPGEILRVYVGGKGGDGGLQSTSGVGGFNGGGHSRNTTNHNGGGGGASDVRQGGSALANRKIVAGGGGGSYVAYADAAALRRGGGGGGLAGQDGANPYYPGGDTPQDGGTQTAAGPGGGLGVGGPSNANGTFDGPGGGGGFYGGSRGVGGSDVGRTSNYDGGGAGGGSSYIGGVTEGTTQTAVRDGNGQVIITANAAPLAPSWVTPQNTVIPTDADFDLDWDHNDPDPGDTQSEYVLDRWTLDANGARVAGSLLRVTVATPNTYRRITAGSLAVGAYEYKVATRDSQGAPTDPAQLVFSESLFVTAAESPDPPTFVAPGPIAGETIGTSSREYVISAPDVDASEWTLYADNAGVIDTSTVLAGPVLKETGDLRRHTFTGLANNTAVWAAVEIKDGGLWSQPTQQRNPVAYSPPPAPTYTLLEDPAEGEIVVQINNPAPGAGQVATSYNDVFITDPGKAEERRATMVAVNGSWTYHLPVSGYAYDGSDGSDIRVVAVAENGVTSST